MAVDDDESKLPRLRGETVATRTTTRLVILGVLLVSLFTALALRTVQLTVMQGADLAQAAEGNRTREVADPAPRGLILDSSGRPMVGNSPEAALALDRQALNDSPDGGVAQLEVAATALGLTQRQLSQRLISCAEPDAPPRPVCDDGNPVAPVVVAHKAADEKALLAVAESPSEYPALEVVSVVRRTYPFDELTAGQLLGYLGEVSGEELAEAAASGEDLSSFDRMGRGGLEQQYDAELRGTAGRKVMVVDSRGNATGVEQASDPVPGHNLVTSVNAELQQRVERELSDALARAGRPKARGAAVVLDADEGRVLAMSSQPDYDPRDWVGGISQKRYEELSRSGALLNYPIQGQAPPGSVFKPVTLLAMADEGFSLRGGYDCPGSYQAGQRSFTNYNSEKFGTISLRRAMEVSCNTIFYRAADRMWRDGGGERVAETEIDPVANAAAELGFGSPTGVDLPAEASGFVASPAAKYGLWQEQRDNWCSDAKASLGELQANNLARAKYLKAIARENCRTGNRWRQGDAINAAIGQGLTTTTPIQMAAAYATIANGGRLVTPTVGKAIVTNDGDTVRTIPAVGQGRVKVSRSNLRFLRSAMTGVPTRGTAVGAFAGFPLAKHPVAGKTGSAQMEGKQSTSWFASFAPAVDPKYVVVVMITEGGTGGENAAPAARGIYESIFGVNTEAVFPRSGPPSEIPKISGVSR